VVAAVLRMLAALVDLTTGARVILLWTACRHSPRHLPTRHVAVKFIMSFAATSITHSKPTQRDAERVDR